jgi:hypothetical protein
MAWGNPFDKLVQHPAYIVIRHPFDGFVSGAKTAKNIMDRF